MLFRSARLKEGEASIVDDFPSASILFADIVKFSSWAGSIGSRELVAILGDLFSRMDTLCGKHGAEKIKTLGDAYMAVAGLPVPRADHADALVALAVDFQRALAGVNKAYGLELQMRVGINTGPVVAGIIGTRKFVYDLWGNAVNLASRMESTCPAGCIQISDSSYRLLSDRGPWLPRGRVPVKNCGEMEAWVYKTRWAPARESGREASARLAERN